MPSDSVSSLWHSSLLPYFLSSPLSLCHVCFPFTAPIPCPAGTYSFNGSVLCSNCSLGFICPAMSTTPEPTGIPCPAGGWCDGRRFHHCPSGTYSNVSSNDTTVLRASERSTCVPCPAGYHCLGPGTTTYEDSPCPAGHYCPEGTRFDKQFPCPAGTYNPDELQSSRDIGCRRLCPAGK